jgi:Holliday junction resolvase
MSRKSKGINAERELIHLFWSRGYACIRVAGSGSSHYPNPDLIASNSNRTLAIECKASRKLSKYVSKEEVQHLMVFSKRFGAEPWIAVRFDKKGWFFIKPGHLKETNRSCVVDLKLAKEKGVLFENL